MKSFRLALIGLIAFAAVPLLPARAQAPGEALLLPGEVVRVAGALPLVSQGKVTGFAFGPGRQGIAYCLQLGGESSLRFFTTEGKGPYLIWGAPSGANLAGPVRWSPDGLRIALRQLNKDGTSDLLVAQYQGARATPVLKGAKVSDYIWSPDGKWIACLVAGRGPSWPGLTLIPSSGGEKKALASAAADVRWGGSGKSLTWLEPSSRGALAGKSYHVTGGPPSSRASQPMRPAGSLWSPDGLLCAAVLTYAQAPFIFQGDSAAGRPISGVGAARLLCWSPDSKILLGLDVEGRLFSASALPPDPRRASSAEARQAREVSLIPMLLDIEAGPPSWSADGKKIAFVLRPGAPPFSSGGLILATLERTPLPSPAASSRPPEG